MRLCLRWLRLCVRVRGRRPVRAAPRTSASQPSPELLRQQAAWLAPARARLLRNLAVGRRRRVLDLGAGPGAVTAELVRRAGGPVIAVDREAAGLPAAGAPAVCADAARLPFADGTFDLIFCQFALLWMPLEAALDEITRLLQPGGALAALEPDYGGLLEAPPETAVREVWLAALARAGADPLVGRRAPGRLAARGYQVRVELLGEVAPAEPGRFEYLRELPLTETERAAVTAAAAADRGLAGWARLAHLPVCLLTALRP